MNVFDVILAAILLIIAVGCLLRGFAKEVLSKAAWILGVLLAFMFYSKVNGYLIGTIKIAILSKLLSFILVFVIVFLVIRIIAVLISRIFQGEILGSLDKILGFILGAIEGVAAVFLIIYILNLQPWFSTAPLFDGSLFYKMFQSYLPQIIDSIKAGGQ